MMSETDQDSMMKALADQMAEASFYENAPVRFLEAWKKGVELIGPEFFMTRRPGLGAKDMPLASVDLIRDKWQACPDPDAVEAGLDVLSSGEAALLVAMCSFYNPEWGGGLMRHMGINGLADLASRLDLQERQIITDLLLNYTGW